MRYFTRQRYELLQADRSSGVAAWQEAIDEYAEYMEAVRASLSDDVASVLDPYEFHDGKIRQVVVGDESVELTFRDRYARAQPTREVRLEFKGVMDSSGVTGTEGRYILYTELHVKEPGQYQYRVLMDEGEMSINFASVAFRCNALPRSKRPFWKPFVKKPGGETGHH